MCVLLSNIPGNSIIWSPSTARDIDAVESVQRRFTKRLPTLKNLSYRERLKCLNIFSLELRRLHTDLFWCYKIVFGLVYVNLDDLFVFSPCQYTRGHKFKLYKRQTNSCVRANFFSERVINCWNSLPHTNIIVPTKMYLQRLSSINTCFSFLFS